MLNKPGLILVDDHFIFRQGLKLVLTEENIATVIGEASNGIEFLELLSYLRPDVVIMDIDMPLMNGIEATKKALEIIPDLKIIVFTMSGNNEFEKLMTGLGVKAYLLKSKGISELEKVINELVKGINLIN